MSAVNAKLIEEVRERSIKKCIELATQLVDSQMGVGDRDISREDRIARFVDYAQRGVLDALKGMGAPVYDQLVNEYMHDMAHSAYMNTPPEPINQFPAEQVE